MSQFLVLIYDDESAMGVPGAFDKLMQGHAEFGEKNGPAIAGGNALESISSAMSIRPDGAGGFAVTAGPFTEGKVGLGGYYLVNAADIAAAIELAKQIPTVAGGLEVRPIHVYD